MARVRAALRQRAPSDFIHRKEQFDELEIAGIRVGARGVRESDVLGLRQQRRYGFAAVHAIAGAGEPPRGQDLSHAGPGRSAARSRCGGRSVGTKLAQSCDSLASGTVNPPSGAAYLNKPDVGSGYQGEEYLPAVAALGLCYRTASGLDDVAAGSLWRCRRARADAMATPRAPAGSRRDRLGLWHPQLRCRHGLRLRLAVPALPSTKSQRVIDSVNLWVDWYDPSGFIKNDPIGNYFVGYCSPRR